MFYDILQCVLLISGEYFYFFPSLLYDFIIARIILTRSPFFIQESFRQTAVVFSGTLFLALNLPERDTSGWIIALCVFWHAERSCLAECPSLRGVSSPSTSTDQLTPKYWVSRWNKDETRNQKRGWKIVIRFATFTFR